MVWRTSSSAEEVTVQVFSTTRSAVGALAGGLEPLCRQQRFQGRAVGLRRAASEILNEVLLHLFIIADEFGDTFETRPSIERLIRWQATKSPISKGEFREVSESATESIDRRHAPARRHGFWGYSFAYSALACLRTGMSASASFQRVRKS